MFISKRNLVVLIIANIIRLILSFALIFKTKINDILKCYLLFFSGGLDDLDSIIPIFLKLYKIDKTITLEKPPAKFLKKMFNYFNFFGPSKNFKDYYNIPDKINDITSNWSFYIYLKKKGIIGNLEKNLLLTVLTNRSIGLFLYFFKNFGIMKKFKVDKKLFFYYPDYFSIFSLYFLIIKKIKKKSKKSHLLLLILFKLIHEFNLHVN